MKTSLTPVNTATVQLCKYFKYKRKFCTNTGRASLSLMVRSNIITCILGHNHLYNNNNNNNNSRISILPSVVTSEAVMLIDAILQVRLSWSSFDWVSGSASC